MVDKHTTHRGCGRREERSSIVEEHVGFVPGRPKEFDEGLVDEPCGPEGVFAALAAHLTTCHAMNFGVHEFDQAVPCGLITTR